MYSNIFDTHAHYDDSRFDDDREELVSSLFSKGVSQIINCACDYNSCLSTLELTRKHENVYAALGVHAHEAVDLTDEDYEKILGLFNNEKVVAVGEIGLDYHYDFSPRDVQKDVFERQLILARELDLPVIIHDREAHEDTMNLLKKYRPKGVVHCFSGSAEMAKEVIKLGMYIGIGGAVTFKNAKKPVEVVKEIPLDRLLLETDAPYMTPVPFRGQRCDSSHIAYTAEKIAEIKNAETQQIIDICNENAQRLFVK